MLCCWANILKLLFQKANGHLSRSLLVGVTTVGMESRCPNMVLVSIVMKDVSSMTRPFILVYLTILNHIINNFL